MKTLIIFGAYGALGRGCSYNLSKDYDTVYLIDRKDEGIFEKDNVINIRCSDLSVEDNVKLVFDKISVERGDSIFLLSTIGGFVGGKKLWDTTSFEFAEMYNKNVLSNFYILKNMLQHTFKEGSLCLISSMAPMLPNSDKIAYSASKSMLNHIVKSLSNEVKNRKVSINAIAPSIIDTPENRKWMPDENFDSWLSTSEIANCVDFIFKNFRIINGNILELPFKI